MTCAEHKRQILRDIATILEKDNDLMPDEIDPDSPEAKRWEAARDALSAEFFRRARVE